MPTERESQPVPLTSIRINLKDRSITLESNDKPLAKVSLAPEGVIFFQSGPDAALSAKVVEATEKEKTIALSGRLKSQPKEGKPDSRGHPTAWARLAVHDEGRPDARLYLVSFHRHTAQIALGLPRDALIVAEGYPHPSADPKKLDTFSVINLVKYPGMPEKKEK